MVSRKVKFRISIENLHIEFEGNQKLGQQIQHGVQQAIGGLMNTQSRRLSAPHEPAQVIDGTVLDVTN